MIRVVLMCGPAGAGKSTVARQLEAEGMVRLSFDVEAWRRGVRRMPLPADLHAEIESELRARLLDLVREGVDVVLDFAFWSRSSRLEYREMLRPLGIGGCPGARIFFKLGFVSERRPDETPVRSFRPSVLRRPPCSRR